MTDAEVILWSRLRNWPTAKFRRQHPIGIYIADFACISTHLVIEVDGATHSSDAERNYDEARDGYMQERGWRIVRIPNQQIYDTLNDVLDLVGSLLPPPPLRGPPPP